MQFFHSLSFWSFMYYLESANSRNNSGSKRYARRQQKCPRRCRSSHSLAARADSLTTMKFGRIIPFLVRYCPAYSCYSLTAAASVIMIAGAEMSSNFRNRCSDEVFCSSTDGSLYAQIRRHSFRTIYLLPAYISWHLLNFEPPASKGY